MTISVAKRVLNLSRSLSALNFGTTVTLFVVAVIIAIFVDVSKVVNLAFQCHILWHSRLLLIIATIGMSNCSKANGCQTMFVFLRYSLKLKYRIGCEFAFTTLVFLKEGLP